MKRSKIKDRVRYNIDLILSKGTISLILFLGVITTGIIIIAGIAIVIIEKGWASDSVVFAIWKSFTLTLDPGNLASVEGSVGLIIVTAIVTLSGIFITSALIGIINTGLSNRIENLQKGNAKIIEKGHTIILGYNDALFPILSELQISNKSACIVVLGHEDKQVMEEQINRRVPKPHTARIICRSGDVTSAFDLARCSIETCKSIIVNQSEDVSSIRVILASVNYLDKESVRNDFPESKKVNISASINECDNYQVAQIAGKGYAEIIHFDEIVSRLMAHVCYQPGLSSVYMDLFNFSGNEIYIEPFPQLEGKTFKDICMSFEKSTVIGISRGDLIQINPGQDEIIQLDDQLILIAFDDNISHPSNPVASFRTDIITSQQSQSSTIKSEKRLLILGSNELLHGVLSELNTCLPLHSHVTIANEDANSTSFLEEIANKYENLGIEYIHADINRRETLERLIFMGVNHVLVLSDATAEIDLADAKTLAILLHIRDISQKHDLYFGITSELLDIRNRELAQGTNVSDFVISSNISSMLLTQISENRKLAPVFLDLLDSAGSELYMKPSSLYVRSGQETDMYTVAYAASLKKEIFIGYKKAISNGQEQFEIVLNPGKNEVRTFSDKDLLIVIAEN